MEGSDSTANQMKITKPQLSSIVDLRISEKLNGLAERVAGVESLVFLAKQYEILHDYLEHLLPTSNKILLQQFFSQVY